MANETILNYLNKTVINGENSNKSLPIFKIGDVFDKKYEVIEVMSYIDSGEADLYKVKKLSSDEILVLKIYRRENAIKDDVLKKITQINNINVGKILDSGKIDRFAYIVTPFYKVGSLENIISQNIKFKTDMLKSIIKSLNDGINAIHSVGIFHKDVKPANMMISDDGSHVILIDFGISSATNGRTVVATQTGKTPFYSAPETNLGLFSKESDYYSLGISLYELITGFTPFQNINIDDLAKYQQISKIPFSADFDEELKRLIIGLTYNDITNRNALDNPNRRWGYQEVNKWLNGEKVPLPGEGQAISTNNQLNQVSNNNARFSRPFIFKGVKYFDLKELAEALLLNWNDGQDVLFRGKLAMHFDLIENVELQKLCEYAEKWCEKNEDNKDQIFFECIYQFSSDITSLYWHGAKFESVYNFGEELSKAVLENKNEHYLNFVEEPLFLDCLKWYASYVGEKYEENERIINYIHMLFKHEGIKSSYKALKIGNLLTGQSKIKIGNRIFNSVESFNEFITKLQKNKNIQEEDKSVYLSYKNDFLMLKQLYASIKKVKLNFFEVGSIVSFGVYENQPIEWQVLEVKDNKALLLSKHILFTMPFDKNGKGSWNKCSLRKYLNGKFYENCFTKREKNAIALSNLKLNRSYTEDKLYLLSTEEVNIYLNNNKAREATYFDGKDNERWWLRSRGNNGYSTSFVDSNGIVNGSLYGGMGSSSNEGVRVAFQLNLIPHHSDTNEEGLSNKPDTEQIRKGVHTLQSESSHGGVLSNRQDTDKKVIDSHVTQPLKTSQNINDFKVGNIVTLGNYKGPIEWQVLEVKDNKALLLSKHVLFRMAYDKNGSGTWETSSLRQYLNGEFYENCFTQSEKNAIVTSNIKVNSGDTKDRIYLLSVDEVNKYFKNDQERNAVCLDGCDGLWWLRCRGWSDDYAAWVFLDGVVCDLGILADCEHGGVRVAFQLNLIPHHSDTNEEGLSNKPDTEQIRKGLHTHQSESSHGGVLSNRQDTDKKVIDSHVTQPLKTSQNINDFKVGNIVTLGNYKGPIEWQVLEVKDNKALLLSKHILFRKVYDEKDSGTWETSSLRQYLNGEFYENCFTQSEKNAIVTSNIKVNSGDTKDRIYLLSVDEVNKYFKNDQERIAVSLEDGCEDAWWLRCRGGNDFFAVVCAIFGTQAYDAAYVRYDGTVDASGYHHDYDEDDGGVRAALQWNLES